MRSIIFCQAPAKVHAVLNCYEYELAVGNTVTIVIMENLEGLYNFFQDLKLNAEILLIENPIKHRVVYWWSNIIRVKSVVSKLKLGNVDNTRVYFTDVYDVSMGMLMPYLIPYKASQIQMSIDILGGYDYEQLRKGIKPWRKFLETFYSYIYKSHYCYIKGDGRWMPVMDDRKYNFPKIDYSDQTVIQKYKYTVCQVDEKYVILFTEPYRMKYCSQEEYNIKNCQLIDVIHSAGYKVAVKGHPRIGCHKDAEKMADLIIPHYIPSEYIDLSSFEFAVGFTSTSLCDAANTIPTFSIMDICKSIDDETFKWFKDYLLRNGPKVKFVRDYSDIFDSLSS